MSWQPRPRALWAVCQTFEGAGKGSFRDRGATRTGSLRFHLIHIESTDGPGPSAELRVVAVVQVGVVGVNVHQRLVNMRVAVRLGQQAFVLVLMVLIVAVQVGMR